MSTILPSVYTYTPNSLHEANDISLVRKVQTPSGVKRSNVLNYAEYPPLFTQVTDDDEQTSSLNELEYEAKRQADLKVIERWNRNYANVVATPKADPRMLVFKNLAVEPVMKVEVDKVNENEPAVQKFELVRHVNRWVTVVPSRAQRAAMKRSVTESVARETSLVESTVISSNPVSRDRADGYSKRVKARVPENRVEKKAWCGKPPGQTKVRKNSETKVVSPPARLGFAPMRCSPRPVDTKKWKKIPISKKNVSKCNVLEGEPEVVMFNKFANLKESGLEHNVPTNNPCTRRSRVSRDVVISQKPQVPKSRRGSSKKTEKVLVKQNKVKACPAELLMINEGTDENVGDNSNVLETEPSEMFLYLLRNLTRTSSLAARVLPLCGHERDWNRFHKCCFIGPSNDYDCLYVPFGGNLDVESLAVCDRTVSKEDESIASRVILCMTNCEKGDITVDSTEAHLRAVLNQHGWCNYEVHVRIFKCLDREMCLLACVRWFIENGYDSPVQFNRSSLLSHLEAARRLPERSISGNQVCAVTWKNECVTNESCQYGAPDAKLYGGSGAKSSSDNDSFLHKLLNVCSVHESVTRVLSQRAFSMISRQECCVLRDDNEFNVLIIPVLDEQSAPRAMLVCDRRCTPVKALNFLPVVPGGRKRWGKADDRALKQLLEMHGFQDIRIKFVCRKECEKVELYLLTALKFMLNGSYDDTDLASVAVDSSIEPSSPKELPQHLKCSFSSDGCHCYEANTMILENTSSEEIMAKPKATPLKRRSGVVPSLPRSATSCRERSVTPRATPLKRKSDAGLVSPSTVSPSPLKTRRVYRDKLTKGIELMKRAGNKGKTPREKKVVIGSLSTLNEGEWVEGEVLNAFLRLVQELHDSHYRILDPNLDEFESDEIKVPGFPLKGLALYPINVGRSHWCLGVMNFDTKKVIVYDSIKSVKTPSTDCMARVQKVWRLCTDSKLLNKNVTCSEQVCEQTDSCNCGLFTCYHGLCLITERPFNVGFTSAVAQSFRITIAEFLRSNLMVRDEEGSIFENAVYTFPTDSLVMLNVVPQLELRVETQPLPLPVFPKTRTAERRTTPRLKSVERSVPKSRVTLGRRKASEVGTDSIVASKNDVLKTPLKANTDSMTPMISKVAPIRSTPNTIDKMSAQLKTTCISKDGESPLKQPRITRSASVRKLLFENSSAQNKNREEHVVEPVTTNEPPQSIVPTPTTIEKMTVQLEKTVIMQGVTPQKQPNLTRSSSGKSGCSRQLFSQSDAVQNPVPDVAANSNQDPDPVRPDPVSHTTVATARGKEMFSRTSIENIMLLICSHANSKTVVLSQHAMLMGGIPRKCCSLSRNEFSLCVLLIKEKRKPTGLLICDRRSSDNAVVTLYAPHLVQYTYIDETLMYDVLKQHGWSDYKANVFRRKNVTDVKAYFTNIMLSVLVAGVYEEANLSIRRVAAFLEQHSSKGKNLINGICGLGDVPCKCPSLPNRQNHALTQAYSFVPPPFVALTCVDREASQNSEVTVQWTKKTHIYTRDGDKKEVMLESLNSLRRSGSSFDRYLFDYIVHAFCVLLSLSQTGINCIIDPLVLTFAQNIPGYKDEEFPNVSGVKFFPICQNQHWVLAVLDFDNKIVTVFDSLQHTTNSLAVKDWIVNKVYDVWELYTDSDLDEVRSAPLNLIAKQTNDYNCGVYVCYHVLRQIMRLNDDPKYFTELSADKFRDEISLWLRENFHVRDELVANESIAHVELFAQAPVIPQKLEVIAQDPPNIDYHTYSSCERGGGNCEKKNDRKKVCTGNPYDRQPYMNDDYMFDRNSDIMCSSDDENDEEDVTVQRKVSAIAVQCSPLDQYLQRICAKATRKVVILSPSFLTESETVQKCCVFNSKEMNYVSLVWPIVINKNLCSIVVATKVVNKKTKKATSENIVIFLKSGNMCFTGSYPERNIIRKVLRKHGWNKPNISAKTLSGVYNLLLAVKNHLTEEAINTKITEQDAQKELELIPNFTGTSSGMLVNGECQEKLGVCGCPLSPDQSLICSYLKHLQTNFSDKTKIVILSPRLMEGAYGLRNKCAVWNKMLNNYDIAFMPIEIEGTYGLVRVNRKKDKNRNRNATLFVGISLENKFKEPSITTELRKKIKSVFNDHELPIATIRLNTEHTKNVIAHVCFTALQSVQENVSKVDFMKDWSSNVNSFKDLRSCAHLVKCPCKLYGDSKARKGCAIYKDTHLLPNGWSLGPMSKRCEYCDAHLFASESSAICCQNGKVKVTSEELSQKTPEVMEEFKNIAMNDGGIFSKTMQINNHISLGRNIYRQRDIKTPGERTLVIEGTYTAGVCHVTGRDAGNPAFAQIYLTAADTLNACMSKYSWQTKKIKEYMLRVVVALKQNNVLLQNYITSGELLNAEKERRKAAGVVEEPRLLMVIKDRREDIPDGVLPRDVHSGRINKPAVNNQVACIYVGDMPKHEDIVQGIRIRERGGETVAPHFLSNLDGLLFVILFPNGEVGYIHDVNKYKRPEGRVKRNRKIEADPDSDDDDDHNLDGSDDLIDQDKETRADIVSRREFSLYMLARRGSAEDMKLHRILGWGKLTTQWILFSWTRVEADRIAHITKNVTEIRGIHQSALFTRLDAELQRKQIPLGSLTYLPSSYIGSPKWQQKNFKNAMCVAQKYGNPHIFATMTGNADWEEIKANRIHTKDGWITDPMLVARVFHEKLQEFLNDIRSGKVFGEIVALQYSIEFQKRGMPHAHILITLKHWSRDPAFVDRIVCAELPQLPDDVNDPTYDSIAQLREKVIKHMIHRPCKGKTRMSCRQGYENKDKCRKKFPFDHSEVTYVSKTGHHIYRRRKNIPPFVVGKNQNKVFATNADVVPYNKWLLSKYDCHLNVEIVSSATACKYIFKYIYKGPDTIVLELTGDDDEAAKARKQHTTRDENNEPVISINMAQEHVNARYVSQVEAAYRLLGYAMQGTLHTVIKLSSHEPDGKFVYFHAKNQNVPMEAKKSELEAYFELIENERANDGEDKDLTWTEVAEKYRFDKTKRVYIKRLRKKRLLAYLNFVPPKFPESYAVRLLLTQRAASSFDDLRTITGVMHPTFVEAAVAAGYMHADEEWDRCLALVSHHAMPREIRRVFASLLVYCKVVNGRELWEKHKEAMRNRRNGWSANRLDQYSLSHIDWILRMQGMSLKDYNMDDLLDVQAVDPAVQYDPDNDIDVVNVPPVNPVPQLNAKQTQVLNTVLAAVQQPVGAQKRVFFLYGKAGCGKTFTYNQIIRECRAMGKRVIAVASTGIAATILDGGRTAHSTFQIPIDLEKDTVIRMDARSQTADRLRKADLICWDEAPMQSRYAMEAVDRMMRDISEPHRRKLPFGGTTVVFGGDWSQFLPVVRCSRGGDLETETIKVTLKSSELWADMTVLTLDQNMRVAAGQEDHMQWLRNVGEGRCQYMNTNCINLPQEMYTDTEQEIIDWMYTPEVLRSPVGLGKVALLSVKNDDTLDLNEQILKRLPGREYILNSADECANQDTGYFGLQETVEFLNTQTPAGFPPHKLTLRVGCIVMLLRNIDVAHNLCNGTRLEVLDVLQQGQTHLLRCRHLNAANNAECYIQRMPLTYEDKAGTSGLAFKRVQFPVRLSFAMTTNKSQGQTFDKVGLILRTPAFAHGSTYVALSRCTSKEGIKVTMNRKPLDHEGRKYIPVRNIVYRRMIEDE